MKEEPPDDGMISGGGDGGLPHMMQHLQGGVPGGGLLRQQDGTLLSHAALQAALMASLAAQQASQLQYQQALLGPAGLRLPQGHPLSSASHALQQREALLAWSKLAAQSAGSVRFPPPISMQPLPQVSNNKLDDSGIQTSPKVDSTSNSASSSLLTPYGLLRHDSAGGGTPSPTNSSPPTNGSSGGGGTRTQGEKKTPGSREKVFVCQICNRSFGYKHVLQNHERTHTGEKPFECKECHKRFTRDHHLKTHMRLHTGEKPYHCSHCDRQFVQVANLRRHLRVHTGERPYACELCESKFSDSNQLKAHMLIHKGEKPFRCEHCFGTYRRRHHLMHHRCSREPTHTSLIGGLLGSEEDHEVDSEARSDASSGERMKSLSVTDVVGLGGGVGVGGGVVVEDPMGLPSDLSAHRHPSVTSEADEFGQDLRRRGRKQKETRRVIRVPEMSSTVTSCYPEQTEPEDLSLHSARGIEYKTSAEFPQHQNPVFSSQQA